TKEYRSGSGCPGCIRFKTKLNESYAEIKKKQSQKEMKQKINNLEKQIRELEHENLHL
ncbi:24195_t:CDS:1, partial [Cetraspora pellucida]